ncbi:cGMP-specific phosphodiesterase [Heterostelium album PN500]|uniref:SREBP regulating gene protein n=1 Tax=Heterostelium pallidum (strain ATCC 26659 / Pp 5 / PN500) TaxID=670386 RepID=D3B8I6_HETP5|nr:cGMP-specific phosphodiesterase [Heterostelium album PN500]EFA82354.1 cGMP-specific phosphodiesterase [Heterostelium album PN500]|eukprot:XP_020434471.1 cGMP-specific phosphodiesterase [Heterostelium album PN500]
MRLSIKVGLLALVFLTATIILLSILQLDQAPTLNLNFRERSSTHRSIKPSLTIDFKWGPTDHSITTPRLTSTTNADTRGLNDISTQPTTTSSSDEQSASAAATATATDQQTATPNTSPSPDKLSSSDSQRIKCRNTVQGTKFIADDQGFNCLRSEVDKNGCCIVNNNNNNSNNNNSTDNNNNNKINQYNSDIFKRFSCYGCSNKFHCCNEYELCVSCCMGSDKVPILEEVLGRMLDKGISSNYLRNQFELCTMTCRTSSRSLIHQREYIEPDLKFCYGTKLPP